MKNKVIKFLENPKIVISITLLIAVVVGFFVYKFVGYAPKMENVIKPYDTSFNQIKDGENIDLAFPKTGRVNTVYVKSGDFVKKGQVLANLDFTDAQGALEIAKANYQKIINGATGADVDLAKATVQTAKVNLDTITKQQLLAVESSYRNLLNSIPEAVPVINTTDYVSPTISGNYNLEKEGNINIDVYYSGNGAKFSTSGLVSGDGTVTNTTPQAIGNSGLYIKFPSTNNINVSSWVITIPNKKASNYLTNYNAYQSALEAQKRLTDVAQANLDQANSALMLKVSSARPEDVAAAIGALQVAQGAYNNDFVYAPADGVITAVNLSAGEIASANQRIISMVAKK